jgi:hypothetical protein
VPKAARKRRRVISVTWIVHRKDAEPVKVEGGFLTSLDRVVSSCQRRLPAMRLAHPETPPDGFVVFDADGNEVLRRVGSASA